MPKLSEYNIKNGRISITIYDKLYSVPCRYKAGDVIGVAEAEELNRHLARAIRNNFSQKVRHEALKNNQVLTQEDLEDYARTFKFGKKKARTSLQLSPLEVAERNIAEKAVAEKLREKGIQPDQVSPEDFNLMVGGLLNRGTFRKKAELAVETASRPPDLDLDFELDLPLPA